MSTEGELALGWRVNKELDPEYWLLPDAAVGRHSQADLVIVPGRAAAHHTIIVAQSGAGKSYLLGRLVEELLSKTKSRVVIFDPNSDFQRFSSVRNESLWNQNTGYDQVKKIGDLPEEATHDIFESRWLSIGKIVNTANGKNGPGFAKLEFNWLDLAPDFLSEDGSSALQEELHHCHELVSIIAQLDARTLSAHQMNVQSLLNFSHEIYEFTKGRSKDTAISSMKARLGIAEMRADNMGAELSKRGLEIRLQEAIIHVDMISEQAARFYFSKAHTVLSSGRVDRDLIRSKVENSARLQVVDLASVPDPQLRTMTVSALLNVEWKLARKAWEQAMALDAKQDTRVPTFIIVDEAHHLVPVDAKDRSGSRLREQFRAIAAEGRKFGLFLILVSQRPDKLDGFILSECENRAMMKVGSDFIIQKSRELLGLDSVSGAMAERCIDFRSGRVLLIGPWAAGPPIFMYVAARRTEEGGRNLRPEHWAQVP